jgi:hypothetical protein
MQLKAKEIDEKYEEKYSETMLTVQVMSSE